MGKHNYLHNKSSKLLFYIVLDSFVEAVHLVHEHDGALLQQSALGGLRLLHGLADVLDAAQHGADGDELRIKGIGHQARNRGLAHSRRPPEYATVRATRLEGQAQRHALSQHMLLADDFGQSVRPQALGQGLMGNGWGMGIDVRDHDPSSIQRYGRLCSQMGRDCFTRRIAAGVKHA